MIEGLTTRGPDRARRHIRLDSQVAARAGRWKALQITRQRDSTESVGPGNGGPVVDLVLSSDASREVDPPDRGAAHVEPKRVERQGHLDNPAVFHFARAHEPDRVPARVHLTPLVGDLLVRAGTGGIGHEDETVPPIGKGVENHLEGILIPAKEVLTDLVDYDTLRVAVVAICGDIEVVAVVGEANFRFLGGGLPFLRLALHETTDRPRHPPDGVVQRSIDVHRCGGRDGHDLQAAAR